MTVGCFSNVVIPLSYVIISAWLIIRADIPCFLCSMINEDGNKTEKCYVCSKAHVSYIIILISNNSKINHLV